MVRSYDRPSLSRKVLTATVARIFSQWGRALSLGRVFRWRRPNHEEMDPMRRPWRGALAGLAALSALAGPAAAETLRVTYAISLLNLPIGTGVVKAEITPSSYAVEGSAKLNALARLVNNSHGASTGHGAIVDGRVSPATFATTAVSSSMTRTIRMAIRGNAVAGVDISPPFGDSPDRVPLRAEDQRNIVDPVGAYIFPAPKSGPELSPEACDRKLSYVEEKKVKARGYSGPVAVCAVRYVPIAGHRKNRPATKFMAENRDIQIWLAPVQGLAVLAPYRVSIKTMVGTLDIEATEFAVAK
jgi:hypothetical protein